MGGEFGSSWWLEGRRAQQGRSMIELSGEAAGSILESRLTYCSRAVPLAFFALSQNIDVKHSKRSRRIITNHPTTHSHQTSESQGLVRTVDSEKAENGMRDDGSELKREAKQQPL